jgi:F0F1-type ATP synthase assembly protein I
MVLSVVIGYGIGRWLDRTLETQPWLTSLFTILGFVAGFLSLLRLARQMAAEDESEMAEVSEGDNQERTVDPQ